MTTVLSVYNSEGCVGRCDARCHEAVEPACDCICGGRNHGVGTGRAIANTREHVERMTGDQALAAFSRQHHIAATRAEAAPDVFQLDLDLEAP